MIYRMLGHDQGKGLIVIIADTKYTPRWQERGLVPNGVRGDLAFHTDDDNVLKILVSWADEFDEYRPKCIEDLTSAEVGCLEARCTKITSRKGNSCVCWNRARA